jgi:hypothetical protein
MDTTVIIIVLVIICVICISSIGGGLGVYFFYPDSPTTKPVVKAAGPVEVAKKDGIDRNMYPASCIDSKGSSYYKTLLAKPTSSWTGEERNTVIYNLDQWGLSGNPAIDNDTLKKSVETCDNIYPKSCKESKSVPYYKNMIAKDDKTWTDDERNTAIYNLRKWGLSARSDVDNKGLKKALENCDNYWVQTCEDAKSIPYFKNLANAKAASVWSADDRNTVIWNMDKWGLHTYNDAVKMYNADLKLKLRDCNK